VTEFISFPKIPRQENLRVAITEKIDGTNAQIVFNEDGTWLAGSRNRWLSEDEDNFGFYKYVLANHERLRHMLGVGRHYGEWWGMGIQRGYGLREKRFSIFEYHPEWPGDPEIGLGQVPVLYQGKLAAGTLLDVEQKLLFEGSMAAPGFMRPEGFVVRYLDVPRFITKVLFDK
jgi:hypothetical protein